MLIGIFLLENWQNGPFQVAWEYFRCFDKNETRQQGCGGTQVQTHHLQTLILPPSFNTPIYNL